MRVSDDNGKIAITVDRDELSRLVSVITEAVILLSRPEFFIRTGCAKPEIEELTRQLRHVADGVSAGFEMEIPAGVEVEENPPRPRP